MAKHIFCDYIEGISREGITGGCGVDAQGHPIYCPDRTVTRGEMAVFIWKAMVRAQENRLLPRDPPLCTGIYADVQCGPDPEPIPDPPLSEIKFTTRQPGKQGYINAIRETGGLQYSGDWVVGPQQWGAWALNARRSTWSVNGGMISPVTDKAPGFAPNDPAWQPASFCKCSGDFHQSADTVVASSGAPKWVVSCCNSLGTHFDCEGKNPSKVQVYKLSDANGLRYHGQVEIDCLGGGGDAIIGDIAYIKQGNNTYIPVDLNTLLPTSAIPNPPGEEAQNDIAGYTYTLELDGVQPPTGASKLKLVRHP